MKCLFQKTVMPCRSQANALRSLRAQIVAGFPSVRFKRAFLVLAVANMTVLFYIATSDFSAPPSMMSLLLIFSPLLLSAPGLFERFALERKLSEKHLRPIRALAGTIPELKQIGALLERQRYVNLKQALSVIDKALGWYELSVETRSFAQGDGRQN